MPMQIKRPLKSVLKNREIVLDREIARTDLTVTTGITETIGTEIEMVTESGFVPNVHF